MSERNPHVAEPFRSIVNAFAPKVATVQCVRCHVSMPADKVNVKDRCLDEACPLKKPKES